MGQILRRTDFKDDKRDFPGGAVGMNLPVNAGDMGLIPGPGRFHIKLKHHDYRAHVVYPRT